MTVKQKQKSNMANIMHDSSLDLLSLVTDVSSYMHGVLIHAWLIHLKEWA